MCPVIIRTFSSGGLKNLLAVFVRPAVESMSESKYSKHAFESSLMPSYQFQNVSTPSLQPSLVRLKVPEETAAY